MTTSKARAGERLESSNLLSYRLKIILADVETAASYARKTGNTVLISDVNAIRTAANSARRSERRIRDRLIKRLAEAQE